MRSKFSIPCCNHELPDLNPLGDVQVLGKEMITGISLSFSRRLMVSDGTLEKSPIRLRLLEGCR